ncbi:MAG TPA: TolC family protein, partial [Luteolibacter sp.]|nr:TolC family protein [Luteolibacter sp.]
ARSERLPEVAVGVDAQLYSATGDVRNTVVGIKLSMPWFNDPAYQSQIDAARSRKDAAQAQVETMRREMASMVAMLATEAANAAAQARAYGGDVRNKAQLATESTKAAWISSKATLSDVLDATRSLYAVRLEERRMLAMQLAALEDLEALVPARPARPTP